MNRVITMTNGLSSGLQQREKEINKQRFRLEKLNEITMMALKAQSFSELCLIAADQIRQLPDVHMTGVYLSISIDGKTVKNYDYLGTSHKQAFETQNVREIITNESEEPVTKLVIHAGGTNVGAVLVQTVSEQTDASTFAVINGISNIVGMAVERMVSLRKQYFVETELKVAESIQSTMCRVDKLHFNVLEVSQTYRPSTDIGGDWFYVMEEKGTNNVTVAIGDITGHGISQGLVSLAILGCLTRLEEDVKNGRNLAPSEIMKAINRTSSRLSGDNRIEQTALVIKFDFENNVATYCNAGHPFPIVYNPDREKAVSSIFANQQRILSSDYYGGYSDSIFDLKTRDHILLYTDGLMEAENLKGRQFGRALTRVLASSVVDLDLDVHKHVLGLHKDHTTGRDQEDDICFLTIKKSA